VSSCRTAIKGDSIVFSQQILAWYMWGVVRYELLSEMLHAAPREWPEFLNRSKDGEMWIWGFGGAPVPWRHL